MIRPLALWLLSLLPLLYLNPLQAQNPTIEEVKYFVPLPTTQGVYSDSRDFQIAIDNSNNIYYAGLVTSYSDAPEVVVSTASSSKIIFGKYNSKLEEVWQKEIPVENEAFISSIALSPNNNIIIGGSFLGSLDVDPSENTHIITSGKGNSSLLVQYGNNGEFKWAHTNRPFVYNQDNETAEAVIKDICTDTEGNIHVTGYYSGYIYKDSSINESNFIQNIENTDFIYSPIGSATGRYNAFTMKYSHEGNLDFISNLGGNFNDIGNAIAVDKQGNVFITGKVVNDFLSFSSNSEVKSIDHDVSKSSPTAFLLKLNSSSEYEWIQKLNARSEGFDLVTDNENNIYITGETEGGALFSGQEWTFIINGSSDAFTIKFSSEGNPVWANITTGDGYNRSNRLQISHEDHLLLTGEFSTNIDLNPGFEKDEHFSNDGGSYIQTIDKEGNYVSGDAILQDSETNLLTLKTIIEDKNGNKYIVGDLTGKIDLKFQNQVDSRELTTGENTSSFLLKTESNQNVSGFHSKKQPNTFSVFPSPANNQITLNSNDKGEVHILNLQGEIKITSSSKTIDISQLTEGVYIIKQGTITAKFVKY